ncbi:PAS-domain containing protein [Dongia sedimenti]|uniref:PAS-domain containing protein n=1 Tax=Dongia sedimenti TaxID=3064282 RepID=A0ABU0YSH7_9PROT|nr:PAS-domain containing protein [Rhodospirillaceae bacterium R-7]
MISTGHVVLELIQNVSLIALVAIGYASLRRSSFLPKPLVEIGMGLLFGCGAVLAMALRIEIAPGIFVDGRNIMNSLVVVFCGPVATVIAVAITILYRLLLGGAGALSGAAGAIAAALVAFAFCALRHRHRFRLAAGSFLILGAAVVAAGTLAFAVLNPAYSEQSFVALFVPLLLVAPPGTMLLGLALQNEDERAALQARLREQANLFETVFRSIGDGVVVANAEGEIVLSNPAAQHLTGVTVVPGGKPPRAGTARALKADGKTPVPIEERPLVRALGGLATTGAELLFPDAPAGGRLLSVTGRPLTDDLGRQRGGVVVLRDISPERVLQNTIARTERRFKEAVDAMENGFALFDAEDRLLFYNDGFLNAEQAAEFGNPIGHTFEELTRAFAFGKLSAADAERNPEAWVKWRMEVHRSPPETPVEVLWTDGRWMRVTERRTADGGYVGIWTDITALKLAETRLRDAIENIPEGFMLLDADLNLKLCNRRIRDLYPASAEAFVAGNSLEHILRLGAERGEYPGVSSPAEIESFIRQWMARFRGDRPYFGEGAFQDGRWVLVSHRKTAGGDFVSIRTDITQQKQRERELAQLLEDLTAAQAATERANQELQRNSSLIRAITDAVPALVAFVDKDERYRYCNEEYRDIYGVDPQSLVGQRIVDAVEPEIYAIVKPQIDRVLGGVETSFVRPMIARGVTRHVEQRYIPSFDADGKVDGFYAIAWDITASHQREQALSREALTDSLTGLLNRRGMTEVLMDQAQRWQAGEGGGAVLFLDIDRFKQINDTLGHDVGDELLKVFAERIRGVVRASDKVARQGGDEFVIVIVALEAEEVAKRVAQALLERVRAPVKIGGRELSISTSIGIAVVPPGEAVSYLEMLKESDLALYEAKAAGRDRYALRHMGSVAGASD